MKSKKDIYKNSPTRKQGEVLVKVILKYMPNLKRVSTKEDQQGIDLVDDKGITYQVKHDTLIPETGNLYIEEQEKSRPSEQWRKSPMNADYYMSGYFIGKESNEHIILYIIPIRRIKILIKERGRPVGNETSQGEAIRGIKNVMNINKKEFPIKPILKKEQPFQLSPIF